MTGLLNPSSSGFHSRHFDVVSLSLLAGPVSFASNSLLSQSVKSVAVVDMGESSMFFFFFACFGFLPDHMHRSS